VLGTPLQHLSDIRRDRFRADHLGIIFQQFNLLPYLSVVENVQVPCGFSQRKRANAGNVQATTLRLLEQLNIHTYLSTALVGKSEIAIDFCHGDRSEHPNRAERRYSLADRATDGNGAAHADR
jgi:hypothetical protein